MGSSITISNQNNESASEVRCESVTGSHLFKVSGYSLTKGIGIGKYIESCVFSIGGYDWAILFYPDGYTEAYKSYISFFLLLKSNATDVRVQFSCTILQQNGLPSDMSGTTQVNTMKSSTGTSFATWGYDQFTKRAIFEASQCLKDDAFTMKYTVTVMKETKLKAISRVAVPSSNLNKNMVNLLKSGNGADVSFNVKGERFTAHRFMLAARSAVFQAEFLNGMKENWTDTIMINDIEPPVFKSMLYFIYSDSVPDFEGTNDTDSEKKDRRFMAQHLFVAADRYGLERLRLMCEDVLSKNLCVCSAATTLILAERHNCSQLKEHCLRFMSSPEVFKAVALTDEFHDLVKTYPSILKDGSVQCHC